MRQSDRWVPATSVASRLEVGNYIIYFYDRYGAKARGRKIMTDCYGKALKKARRYAKIAGYRSYRIDRCLFNSLE